MKMRGILRLTTSIGLACLWSLPASAQPAARPSAEVEAQQKRLEPKFFSVRMSDGVDIVVALHLPANPRRHPALLAASPYRIDNDGAPAVPAFPFRETGPIGWYVDNDYAFVRMDVRGTGRSGGEFRVHDKREQRDLYEVVEWIARQPWSNGKVGGIGQSYYARSQWAMATQAPPHLACIAPYDGNMDNYHAAAFTGGIPGNYPNYWYNFLRGIHAQPFSGSPRLLPWDFSGNIVAHPTYDAFWRERSTAEDLAKVKIPVFSIAVWGKADTHLNGNIIGYQRAGGLKKLLVLGGAGIDGAVAEFSSPAFHERYMRPFYDWCLKGVDTGWTAEPQVRYSVVGDPNMRTATSWPPRESRPVSWYLNASPSRSVTSLNDGGLSRTAASTGAAGTTLNYPDPHWGFGGSARQGPDGRPDTARYVLSFTTPPLERDTLLAGPPMLRLHFTSSRNDADFIVKLYEQMPQGEEDRRADKQPVSRLLTKGWLRASHRSIDPAFSLPNAPWYKNDKLEPLVPGKAYSADIALMPIAARLGSGSRIRVEISNADSLITEAIFTHAYLADQVGSYTILHDPAHRSELVLPVIE